METFNFVVILVLVLFVGTIGVELIKASKFGQAIERFNKRMEAKNAALREEGRRLDEEIRRQRMIIEVEFEEGTKLRDAITEAKEKAELWQVHLVRFEFNGVTVNVGPNADVDATHAHWMKYFK